MLGFPLLRASAFEVPKKQELQETDKHDYANWNWRVRTQTFPQGF